MNTIAHETESMHAILERNVPGLRCRIEIYLMQIEKLRITFDGKKIDNYQIICSG